MKLTELEIGTPVKIEVYKNTEKVAEIWGKIKKNARNESLINIYYYDGSSVNWNSPEYDIQATAYRNGIHKIEWNNARATENGTGSYLQEKRDAFRIYIGEVVNCKIRGEETVAMLVDLSEGGFRIVIRELYIQGKNIPVKIDISDAGFNFSITGTVIWNSRPDDVNTVYGCVMNSEQEKEEIVKYIKEKQKKLLEDLQKEI